MRKIIVVGCPGSGKSTFSRKLNKITNIPLYHLDMLFWNSDKTTVEKSVFLGRLEEVLKKDSWIIDGNYISTMERRIIECDTVIFLDYLLEICLSGIEERKGTPRSDMPWVETEPDPDFLEFIKNFTVDTKPKILALLEKYRDKNIFTFKTRENADAFLQNHIAKL